MRKFLLAYSVILLLFLFAGCAPFNKGEHLNNERHRISSFIEHVRDINKEIETCKGTGWITLSDGEKTNRFRIAWAVVFPDKIRMTLLSAAHPVETVITDGDGVSFISHTGAHPVHKIHADNPSLAKIVGIPVTIRDIIAIFAGQIPLREYETVQRVDITYAIRADGALTKAAGGAPTKAADGMLTRTDGATRPITRAGGTTRKLATDTMLVLKKQGKTVEKIVFNSQGSVLSYSLSGKSKRTGYTVFHKKMKLFNGYFLPVKARIIDHAEERSIDFHITAYQPDISINPEVFTLTESR